MVGRWPRPPGTLRALLASFIANAAIERRVNTLSKN
jgi:hypothetical protein